MKITKRQLRRIIRESLGGSFFRIPYPDDIASINDPAVADAAGISGASVQPDQHGGFSVIGTREQLMQFDEELYSVVAAGGPSWNETDWEETLWVEAMPAK